MGSSDGPKEGFLPFSWVFVSASAPLNPTPFLSASVYLSYSVSSSSGTVEGILDISLLVLGVILNNSLLLSGAQFLPGYFRLVEGKS